MIIINCNNKKIEACLKLYRQKIDQVGTIRELRDRKTFKKPSVKKREALQLAKYKNIKYGNSEL